MKLAIVQSFRRRLLCAPAVCLYASFERIARSKILSPACPESKHAFLDEFYCKHCRQLIILTFFLEYSSQVCRCMSYAQPCGVFQVETNNW